MNGTYRHYSIVVLCALCLTMLLAGCKKRDEMKLYLQAAEKLWGFQGTVLVAVDGRVIYAGGYGLADTDFDQPNTPQTKFFIGSITKQFTAAAILRLQDQGQLFVHNPVSWYLPDYPREAGDKITLHHLLTHTSGVPNYTDVPEVLASRTSEISQADLLSLFADKPLQFEPGTEFHYSNSGYILLGAIIEEVSGQSYEAYLHNEILKPAGMFNSGYARREVALPNRAEGYTLDDRHVLVDALPIHMSVLHTAGALYSTVEDMLLWDQALYGEDIISAHARELMFTPYAGSYGYGWFVDTLYGRPHYHHAGYLDGFNTTFERYVDQKLCVVVFANEDDAPVKKIAHGLAAIALEEPFDFPIRREARKVKRERLTDYPGVYQTAPDIFRFVYLDNDTLYAQMSGLPREKLLPMAVDSFFYDNDNTKTLSFVRDSEGAVVSQVFYDETRRYRAVKLSGDEAESQLAQRREIVLAPEVFDRYTGIYELESQMAVSRWYLVVSRRGDRFFAQATGFEETEIFPRSHTDFFHRWADFNISFQVDSTGRANECVLRLNEAEVHGVRVSGDRE